MGVVILFTGIGIGALAMLAAVILRSAGYDPRQQVPRAQLPPATTRQLARFRRRNRADLGPALDHDRRHWLPPSTDDFDRLETREIDPRPPVQEP